MTNITPEREDVEALANAFVNRMTWPSMHWKTQSLDPEAARALALVALQHAPQIILTARAAEKALAASVAEVQS